MAYGDGLENRSRCKTSEGSNPSPSAIQVSFSTLPPSHHPRLMRFVFTKMKLKVRFKETNQARTGVGLFLGLC